MTTIAEGLAAVSAGLNVMTSLLDAKKAYNEAEFKLTIAGLKDSLATAKTAFSDAQEQLRAKDAEIASLKEAFKFRGTLVEVHGYKYEAGKDGKPVSFAFCQRCEQEGKLYRLTKSTRPQYFNCPNCGRNFKGGVTQYRERN